MPSADRASIASMNEIELALLDDSPLIETSAPLRTKEPGGMRVFAERATDEDLYLAWVRDGNKSAFNEFALRCEKSLKDFIAQFLKDRGKADDVFQETMMKLLLAGDSFDPAKPIRPWLYTIAANAAIDCARKDQREKEHEKSLQVSSDEEEQIPMDFEDLRTPHALDIAWLTEEAAICAQIIAKQALRGGSKMEVLQLAVLHGFSYRQIADILKIPVGTVKSSLHAARKLIREEAEAHGVTADFKH